MSRWVECSGQAEVDACIKAGNWPVVRDGYVEVSGSASVRASGSASVRASGSASVSASGSASVSAFGSASVRAFDSASVRAFGSASVRAFGSASVRASGSASVRAFGSASVRASGSASVRAFDSASVSASGSASVRTFDSASVSASGLVAVHRHDKHTKINGGVIIDVPQITTFKQWAEFHGLERDRGQVVVFKAVDADLKSGRGHAYPVGEKVKAHDWDGQASCGGGLHFSQSPHHATGYFEDATRWLACAIPAKSLLIGEGVGADKVKAPSCRVLYEVDVHGDRIEGTV